MTCGRGRDVQQQSQRPKPTLMPCATRPSKARTTAAHISRVSITSCICIKKILGNPVPFCSEPSYWVHSYCFENGMMSIFNKYSLQYEFSFSHNKHVKHVSEAPCTWTAVRSPAAGPLQAGFCHYVRFCDDSKWLECGQVYMQTFQEDLYSNNCWTNFSQLAIPPAACSQICLKRGTHAIREYLSSQFVIFVLVVSPNMSQTSHKECYRRSFPHIWDKSSHGGYLAMPDFSQQSETVPSAKNWLQWIFVACITPFRLFAMSTWKKNWIISCQRFNWLLCLLCYTVYLIQRSLSGPCGGMSEPDLAVNHPADHTINHWDRHW